jgi:hypothetical protein
MKFLSVLVLSVFLLSAAEKPAAIPRGAVKTADGSFRFTDAQGRKWIYRATPFGIARVEEPAKPAADVVDEKSIAGVRAYENGDRIRFERPGPFGTYKWERAKSELNATERAAWEREQSRAAQQD